MISFYQETPDGHEIRKIGDKWYIITDECLTLGPYDTEKEAREYTQLAACIALSE